MIYLFIFIYLLYLSIHYDILENKRYKWTHFRIVIILLILVAGLRWRVGSDTVWYARDFVLSHDLFHLEWSDFESIGKMPIWVLLIATCKTIWNDFLLVQFILAVFGVGVSGYFIKKACPSLCFFILLCYYIGGYYTGEHMELLRESVAVSFYLLGILAIDDGHKKRAILYAFLAFMSHVYAIIAIFIFIICYYLLPHSKKIRLFICFCVFFVVLFNSKYLTSIVQNKIGLLSFDENISSMVFNYATSDKYGNSEKSIWNYLSLVVHFCAYLYMLAKCKHIYFKYIFLKQDIFNTLIFIYIVIFLSRFSFTILYRLGVSYNYFFTCLLSVVFCKEFLIKTIKKRQRVFVYLILLLIPIGFAYKAYFVSDFPEGICRWYSRYYPYSSVFDKTIDPKREKHHELRGVGYSVYYDYGLSKKTN